MTNSDKNYWLMLVVFVLLALSFLFDIWGTEKKIMKVPLVAEEDLIHDTVRNPLTAPIVRHAGFEYSCNECHQNLKPPTVPSKRLTAHENIIMEHGINSNCYNCHDRQNRESLTDINGDKLQMHDSEKLCGKCHGARYNDWLNGVHGRQAGYWDINLGKSEKVKCVFCHNPHSPKFQQMKPYPGPNRRNYSTDKGIDHE